MESTMQNARSGAAIQLRAPEGWGAGAPRKTEKTSTASPEDTRKTGKAARTRLVRPCVSKRERAGALGPCGRQDPKRTRSRRGMTVWLRAVEARR